MLWGVWVQFWGVLVTNAASKPSVCPLGQHRNQAGLGAGAASWWGGLGRHQLGMAQMLPWLLVSLITKNHVF